MKTLISTFVVLGTLVAAIPAFSAEPAYCTYSAFARHEVRNDRSGLENDHLYKFGSFHLVGLGVGNSKFSSVVAMAESLSDSGKAQKYCTWYHNDGNDQAQRSFNWFYVDRPDWDVQGSVREYRDVLKGIFADNAINMVDCATKHGYVALGCDGMKHRGPTIFGMLLAYSGCSPRNAAEIVNKIWGLNTVPANSRLAVIEEGYRLGSANPQARQALQQIFSQR